MHSTKKSMNNFYFYEFNLMTELLYEVIYFHCCVMLNATLVFFIQSKMGAAQWTLSYINSGIKIVFYIIKPKPYTHCASNKVVEKAAAHSVSQHTVAVTLLFLN